MCTVIRGALQILYKDYGFRHFTVSVLQNHRIIEA